MGRCLRPSGRRFSESLNGGFVGAFPVEVLLPGSGDGLAETSKRPAPEILTVGIGNIVGDGS